MNLGTHAQGKEQPRPGERQKLLRFLTQSLAQPGSLCDVPGVTGGRAQGRAAVYFPPISADPYLADTKRRGARSA